MNFDFAIEPHDVLVVHLHDGSARTSVSATPASAGAASLRRALDTAIADGYGECFWPAATGGQYWWIFKRDEDALEVMTMWTRGGAALWEHVFRATDSVRWIDERLATEAARLGLDAATD
jgi:hypothetical protein